MISSIKDFILPFTNIALIAAMSGMLYQDMKIQSVKNSQSQIGTITFKKKVAERKLSEQVLWDTLSQNSPLFNFDSIRTDKDSSAVINLVDGTKIDLDEDTMIVLKNGSAGMNINFEKGAISATKESGSAVNISAGGSTVEVGQGDVNLSKAENAKDVSMNVSSGSAVIKTGSQTQTVDTNSQALLGDKDAKVQKIRIIPTSPENSKYIISTSSSEQVDFSWDSDSSGEHTLQITDNSSFSSIEHSLTTNAKSASKSLPNGTYYWRVVSGSDVSPVRRFTILSETAAVPLYPRNSTFSYRDSFPLVTFKWKANSSATSYIVQISDDPGMSKTVLELSSDGNSISTDKLGEGTYYWRISNNYGFGSKHSDINSDTNSFVITKKSELSPPNLISPSDDTVLSNSSSSIVFNWSSSQETKEYEITLVRISPSKKTIFTDRTSSNYYSSSGQIEEGKYSWRVVAVGGDESKSKPSEDYTFSVSAPQKISANEPADGDILSSDAESVFTWSDPNNGGNYEIEISTDISFGNIIESHRTKNSYYNIKTLSEGKFYWRVYLLDKNETRLIGSNINSFSVESSIGAPVLISPINNEKIELKDKSPITFTWNGVKNATSYKFSLYNSSAGTGKIVYSTEVSSTKFVFDNISVMETGTFYWEIQAMKNNSGASSISREYFIVQKKTILPTPVITSPPVIYLE